MKIDSFLRGLILLILYEEKLKTTCVPHFSYRYSKSFWPKQSISSLPRHSEEDSKWSYDVSKLTENLNLQLCSIVEIGERYCSLFVDFPVESQRSVEVFLGSCKCAAFREWRFCNPLLTQRRKEDCEFHEATDTANTSARVHRRLCDITGMLKWNSRCSCEEEFAGQYLLPVNGFNTCFRPPMPESICSPRSVCGTASCSTKGIFQIQMVQCNEECLGRQPFCEDSSPETSQPRKIHSFWSPWSSNESREGKFVSTASCIDGKTGKAAFDCLGPDSNCCPVGAKECYCEVWVNSTSLYVTRYMTPSRDAETENMIPDESETEVSNITLSDFLTSLSIKKMSVVDLLIHNALQQLSDCKMMKSRRPLFQNGTTN